MNTRLFTVIMILALVPFWDASAQQEENALHFGGGAGLTIPARNFSERYNTGYLFQIVDEVKIEKTFSIAGHLGLYRFPGDEITGVNEANEPVIYDAEEEDIYILTQGVRFHMDNFFAGVELGGLLGNNKPDEISLFPTAGFQIGGFQIDARYKLLGSFDWATVSVSYYLFAL